MPHLDLDDMKLYFERKGEGPPLLFISGTGSDLRNRPNVLDGPLPAHFDTLAYDQRGLGRSAKPEGPYTMAGYADDAAKLVNGLGLSSMRVVGVSFGGMVAQELALRHPQLVTRLVLACTSPGGAGGASYPLHTLEHLGREERARHMIPISDCRNDAAWASANPEPYARLLALSALDPFGDEPGYAEGRRFQLQARAQHDTWERLSGITCPTLICAGKRDGIATPEAQENMAARIAGAELRFFEGGHLFLLQDRQAYPALIEFMQAAS